MCWPFVPFRGLCHRDVRREMFAFVEVFRGWFGRDNEQQSVGQWFNLFVVVFGVLFEGRFELYHTMIEARKTTNNAAAKRYKDGRYQPHKQLISCRQGIECYKVSSDYFMAICIALINHFSQHQLDASVANLLHQNGAIRQQHEPPRHTTTQLHY
jgi:hypothetical protein